MIDLKEEIEGLKNNINTEDYKYNMGCIVVKELENETIDEVLQLLDQYNIITAPKTIKLSELIDKIYETKFKSECWVEPIRTSKNCCRIRVQYGDGFWGDFEFYIEDKKIVMYQDDFLLPFDEFKWLYTLWIAGTIIEYDLKEDE